LQTLGAIENHPLLLDEYGLGHQGARPVGLEFLVRRRLGAGRGPGNGRLATTTKNDQLLLEHEILGDHGSHTTGATELRSHNGEVQQGISRFFMRESA
jgi:hypothetical protein